MNNDRASSQGGWFRQGGMRSVAWAGIILGSIGFLSMRLPADAGVEVTSHYSPRNGERQPRLSTDFILIHTTEGAAKGSLSKIRRNGEAHYVIDEGGKIYAIISRDRVAFHAGRSMWNGTVNLDERALGIEMVGFHNRDITPQQYSSLSRLLKELQAAYNVPDERVLTHSMVAYGAPNRWQRRSHRGRKRCGMVFAKGSVRQRLGLTQQPLFDPDVRSGRLSIGDAYLAKTLYADARKAPATSAPARKSPAPVPPPAPAVATRPAPASPTPASVRPAPAQPAPAQPAPVGGASQGTPVAGQLQVAAALPVPAQAEAVDPADGYGEGVILPGLRSAWDIAKDSYDKETTLYVLPDGRQYHGNEITNWSALPIGTKVIAKEDRENPEEGLQVIGVHGDTASAIAGDEYNAKTTIYLFQDGRVRCGNELRAKEFSSMPRGTGILVGYTYGGYISSRRRAYDACGVRWNYPSTLYRLPDGKLVTGDQIDEDAIPRRALVLFRN